MLRMLFLATLCVAHVVDPHAAAGQQTVRLNIRVVLVDAAGAVTNVPRHVLLISDSPPTTSPRRIVTASDGTAGLPLRPGSYIVESDQPVAFEGQAYRWIQTVDVVAGRDTVLELTVDNALLRPVTASAVPLVGTDDDPAVDADPSALLLRWQDSVAGLWTPTAHASGFVIDQRGLIATSRRLIGAATSIEVQLTPTIKVAGTVIVAGPEKDVAIVRVNPAALTSVSPVSLECALPATAPIDGQEVLAMGVPLRGSPDISFGTVRRVTPGTVAADFSLRGMSAGGPVFAADGGVVGIASVPDGNDERIGGESPIVLLGDVCAAVLSAETAMSDTAPPDGTHLPVEPGDPISLDVLDDAIAQRAGSLLPYPMSSSDFDIAFITPVLLHHGLNGEYGPTMDFSNWSDYVRSVPSVLLVRVTPKQSESFWMKLARGAAWTQGASLPPITHFKSGFARLRAFCGEVEVTPLHPFRLELRLSETEAIHEGLVVFAPDALGPHCGTVTFMLYSEKDPAKADTREVDPRVLRQIWTDFELHRAMSW